MTKLICPQCGGDVFWIENRDCHDCKYNGAYDKAAGQYVYNEAVITDYALERDQAYTEGECQVGQTFDAGCDLRTCIHCEALSNCPQYEE